MGATRKLQGEIDRVLKKVQEGVDVFDSIWNKVYDTDNANQKEKFEADLKKEIKKLQRYRDQIKTWIQSSEIKDKKVSASYEQALMDARKCIEREMERFKICEKETKTKAFSKEGLGQQPKTDPKEKAKSETRDWVNNLVGELETQIDHFEAEIEGLSVKKGKTRPPRLTHLEASIGRHKLHIIKLETILRLLDNDQLSPEQVNDLKDLVEDYVERNQESFEEFSDVDEIYSTLPLDKVDTLEDLVSVGPSALVKGVTSVSSAGAILGLKTSLATSPSHASSTPAADQLEDNASQDGNFDAPPRTPPSKNIALPSSVSSNPSGVVSVSPTGVGLTAGSGSVASHGVVVGTSTSSLISGTVQARGNVMIMENTNSTTLPSPVKDDDTGSIPAHRPSPALAEVGLSRGIGRGSLVGIGSTQSSNVPLSPGNGFHSNGALSTASGVTDVTKRNVVGADDRSQSLVSPLTNRLQGQQIPKPTDGNSNDSNAVGDNSVLGGRVFSASGVSGVQWRPSANSLPNQNEMLRGRAEIAPDHREQFLHRLQQAQQGGHNTLLGMPKLGGASQAQYTLQQQSSLLQQNTPSSNQVGRLGVHSLGGISGVSSSSLTQQNAMQSQNLISPGLKDVNDSGAVKIEDQQPVLADDFKIDHTGNQVLNKIILNEDDSKTLAASDLQGGGPTSLPETSHASRDVDLSSGQPLQLNQPPGSLGVIGRRSVSDLGAIGDNLGASSASSIGVHDYAYNLQMLDAAYSKLPLPKDSERPKSYIPKHPTSTPAFYPQVPAPIFDNPAFWERLGSDNFGTDILFFAFYYQQNTYQQYLAARELKRHSWRYHRKYNTWFQRHEEPLVTNEEYEQGTYVYFDYQVPNDDSKQGWCQRIKTEFTFEYSFLEDELM